MGASNPDWPTAGELRDYREQLWPRGERRLLLVEGDAQQTQRYGAGLPQAFANCRVLWVGATTATASTDIPVIAAHQAFDWLGAELDLIIWNGWQGNPPDAFAALSGTLAAGGLLVWLMPPLPEWPTFADPDYVRTGLADASRHPFAAHLARQLQHHPGAIRLSHGDSTLALSAPSPSADFLTHDTPDQLAAISAVIATGEGRRRRPLVIRADRGRGKSTALGRAAARLLSSNRQRIVVTAPTATSVATLFDAAEAAWPEAHRKDQRLIDGQRQLQFMPPDVLLRDRPDAELVLVDEAAGLPAPLLEQILTGWPRVVFATTVHGYEGTGRGFDIRFRAALDRLTPQWKRCELHQPIRWASGDPLEALANQLFLLDAEAATADREAPVTIQSWSPSRADTDTLKQAFGLLVNAHYRTTPGDLRQWLDDSEAESWVAYQGDQIVGVLWMTREGGLPRDLAGPVMRGERRLRGHLLAQSLASHGGMEEAAALRMGRIVRVAVTDEVRRQGIGKRLVAAALAAGSALSLDLIGTSFGATTGLVNFWHSCGLQSLRLGLHQSAHSGEMNVQMGTGLTPAGKSLADAVRLRFAEHWPLLLGSRFAQLPVDLVWVLTGHWPREELLSAQDKNELVAFADGYRLFELSLLPLGRLSRQPGIAVRLADMEESALWCRAILQGWQWQALQQNGFCTGRKQGVATLRGMARQLLSGNDEI